MHLQLYLCLFIGLVATIEDLWRRQISNWIPLTALIGGIAWQVADKGWAGLGNALLGAVAGFAVFFIFYWLGGMGGGDIKLMAGFGAVLGLPQLWEAAFDTALIGAALAVAWLAVSEVKNRWRQWRSGIKPKRVEAIPYAPAITLGVWLALVPKP